MLNATLEPVFSVALLKVKLPSEIIDNLNVLCDNLDESLDYSPYLAGKIEYGKQIGVPTEKLNAEFISLLYASSQQYILALANRSGEMPEANQEFLKQYQLNLGKVWMVSQLEKDFNPVHSHTGLIAGIIYLKVPPQISLTTMQGCISFIYGRNKYEDLDFNGVKTLLPVVGDMYLLPAWMQHTVYPFYGEGERRCLAFNFYNTAL